MVTMDMLLCLCDISLEKKMSVAVTGFMAWLKSVEQVMLRHRTWHLSWDAAFGSIRGGVLHLGGIRAGIGSLRAYR